MFNPSHGARASDPITSHEAARQASAFVGTQCERIHRALELCGPMDPEQIGDMLDMEPYAVRKRLSNLKAEEMAEPTGEIVKTRSGRSQRVWRAL